jgi:hypothetical protein
MEPEEIDAEALAPGKIVVAAICGSLRPGSHTRMALETALEGARQVTRFAYLHTPDRARAFLEAWENAPPNPGGANWES